MATETPNPAAFPDDRRGAKRSWPYWGVTIISGIASAVVIAVCSILTNWVANSVETNRGIMLDRSSAIEKRLDRLEQRLIFLEQQRMTTARDSDAPDNEHVNQSTPGN